MQMKCVLPFFQEAGLSQEYLAGLKEYLKNERPLDRHNSDLFFQVHDDIFSENGIEILYCFGAGKFYLEGKEIGQWDGPRADVLMPKFMSRHTKSLRIGLSEEWLEEHYKNKGKSLEEVKRKVREDDLTFNQRYPVQATI